MQKQLIEPLLGFTSFWSVLIGTNKLLVSLRPRDRLFYNECRNYNFILKPQKSLSVALKLFQGKHREMLNSNFLHHELLQPYLNNICQYKIQFLIFLYNPLI